MVRFERHPVFDDKSTDKQKDVEDEVEDVSTDTVGDDAVAEDDTGTIDDGTTENEIDVVQFRGKSDKVTISVDPETGWITISNPAVTLTVEKNKAERVEMEDGTLAFDTDGNAGDVYRLYEAAFDREPDPQGLGYWVRRLDDGGINIEELAQQFLDSQEFEDRYDEVQGDEEAFVEQLYVNILGREGDPEGVAYWAKQLNSTIDKAELLAFFADAEENQENVAPEIESGIFYI